MIKDLTNQPFGNLTVQSYAGSDPKGKGTLWNCLCKCGNEIKVRADRLTDKNRPTVSCGCVRREKAKERHKAQRESYIGKEYGRLTVKGIYKIEPTLTLLCECSCGSGKETHAQVGQLNSKKIVSCGCYNAEKMTKHGGYKNSSYKIWVDMKQRCNNPNNEAYKYYGGRGIRVCPAWKADFSNFLNDMGERPSGHTLDRKDPNGNYEPSNCAWATTTQQARNRRFVKLNETKVIHIKELLTKFPSDISKTAYMRKIASQFEVSYDTIYSIYKGKIWKEI